MTLFDSIILGIVEGLTEFLPISSTAHLDFFRLFLSISPTEFIKSFEIIIQLGAILAVVVLFWKKIFSSFYYVRNILIAFIPTGIIGFFLYKIIRSVFLTNPILASTMLVLGGIVILFVESKLKPVIREDKEKIEQLSVKELLILGGVQALAVIPGVSRSGAVIICGRIIKIPASLIAEFSFLLAIPTMFFATLYDIYKSGIGFSGKEWELIVVGFVVAFFVALLVVKWFINYIKTHDFKIFGWYRIIFGILVLIFILL